MGQAQRRIIPLNPIDEALTLFNQLEERLCRIRWIRETLTNPDEIRRGHLRSKPVREVYLTQMFESEDDQASEYFLVGVDRRLGRLDFRTAFVPEPSYLNQVRRGTQLWPKQGK